MNFNIIQLGWTGKLQVTLHSVYISRKKLCSQTFKALLEEIIVKYSEKKKGKCMKEVCERQVGISQLHNRLTSSQTVFRDFK